MTNESCELCFSDREINYSKKRGCRCCLRCHLMPHIAESHPEPEERQPMPKYNPNAETPQVQLLTGDYPFEIVGVSNKISQGAKTRGCDQRDVRLDFYADDTFRVKVASITDT